MMMKKSWKNRSGVSPVIATILMVAITVVLAAVLYVMVMGFGSSPNNNPTGGLSSPAATSSSVRTFTVASVTSNTVALNTCRLNLVVAGATGTAVTLTANGVANTVCYGAASPYYWLTYVDVDGNHYVSAGDQIIVSCSSTGVAPYTALAYSTGQSIQLVLLGPNAQIASGTITT